MNTFFPHTRREFFAFILGSLVTILSGVVYFRAFFGSEYKEVMNVFEYGSTEQLRNIVVPMEKFPEPGKISYLKTKIQSVYPSHYQRGERHQH